MRTTLLVAGLVAGSLAAAPVLHAQSSGSLRAVAEVHRAPRDREGLAAAYSVVQDWGRRRSAQMVRRTALARVTLRAVVPPAAGSEPAPSGLVIDIEYLRN